MTAPPTRLAGPATIELRRLSDEMTAELDQFLRKRSTAFDDIDMPIDATRKLIQFFRPEASGGPGANR